MAQDDDQAWNNTVNDPQLEGLDPNTGQQEELTEDNDTPAAPANVPSDLPPDHPAMDTNIEAQEAYDAGQEVSSAATAQDETDEEKSEAINGAQ